MPGAAVERIVRIEPFDPRGDDAGAYAALVSEARTCVVPSGLRMPPAYVLNRLRNTSDDFRTFLWNAWDGATLLGSVEVFWREAPDNRDRAWAHFDLRSDETLEPLAATAAAFLVSAGRPVVVVEAERGSAVGRWLTGLSGPAASADLHNVLRLSPASRADLASFPAPPGYSLVRWDGPAPDDLIEGYARLVDAINDAPTDDLTTERSVYTPERLRHWEQAVARRGHALWSVVARHDATGELAAYNQLEVRPEWPECITNQDTAVAADHRGRGLGLWVKAANLLRALDGPAVCVDTWNAASNAHMLRVNRRLGFVTEHEVEAWEVRAETLLAEGVPA